MNKNISKTENLTYKLELLERSYNNIVLVILSYDNFFFYLNDIKLN